MPVIISDEQLPLLSADLLEPARNLALAETPLAETDTWLETPEDYMEIWFYDWLERTQIRD